MKEEELLRLESMWSLEHALFEKGYSAVAGVDEAGRGPLAAEVYAAAVILPPDICIEGLNDSKKLSEKKREKLYDEICECALAYAVATASVEEIDEFNIRNATYMAMNRAIEALKIKPDFVMVDGDCIKDCAYPHECVIKGDAKSLSIAAASVLAKVSRDRHMLSLAEKYPMYGFEKHKGYGTAAHIAALKEYGACEIHRKTFIKKFV
ncbi:MAG: ribonuclease HII [Ruminococcaceae bacterium]|nr:ribonuclease HII [Oscillospiraceae bacterium]